MVKVVAMAILSYVMRNHIETTGLEQCMLGDWWEETIPSWLVRP